MKLDGIIESTPKQASPDWIDAWKSVTPSMHRLLSVTEMETVPSERIGHISHEDGLVPVILEQGALVPGSRRDASADAAWIDAMARQLLEGSEGERRDFVQALRRENPLFAFITRHRSSWPVMEGILTRGHSLWDSPPKTEYPAESRSAGKAPVVFQVPDWLVYDLERMTSLRAAIRQEERALAVLDTGDLARGVQERALLFKMFWKKALLDRIEERQISGRKEPILGVDFASGSFRYGIEALAEIFSEAPEVRREVDLQRLRIHIFGLESDPAGVLFANDLARKFGVADCIVSTPYRVTRLRSEMLLDAHPVIRQAAGKFDIVSSSGLLDYAHPTERTAIPSKSDFAGFFRNVLVPGGWYANANIARLTPAYPDSCSGRTEAHFIEFLFDWLPMHECTPREFYDLHVREGAWKGAEIEAIRIPPSCGRSMDRSFYVLTAQKEGSSPE